MTKATVSQAIVEHGAASAAARPNVPWWSFTKTVLAAAALALVRDGVLELDRRIGAEPYTLRHLLQHTAGLGDYSELAGYHAAVERCDDPWPVAELLHRSRAGALRYRPGEGWRYSNLGYLKVRQMIERATQMPLGCALRRLVFAPLGIQGATLARDRGDLRDVMMGAADGYHPGWVYHGLLTGPLPEAAQLLDRLLGGLLLPPELLHAMRSARRVGPAIAGRPWQEPGYGLGLMIELAGPDGPAGHTGGGPGSTIAVYRRERGGSPVTVAAFCCDGDQGRVERTAFGAGPRKLRTPCAAATGAGCRAGTPGR